MKTPAHNATEGHGGGLPVNLLVDGQPCLVVGGGPVAHRKTAGLLCAGAAVRVVSPDLCPGLAALAASGRVEHVPRRFTPADVTGARVVFAATNDSAVNRGILDATRTAGGCCCCVDGNWRDGDFTTPAALRMNGLTLAVSTGGRSCRRARMVKDALQRHLRSIETADLLILGTSHEQLPLERREVFQQTGPQLAQTGDMLLQVRGIHEFMLLVTCNRVELAAVASGSAGRSGLLERILGLDRLNEDERYRLTGAAAFEHMAMVTAGMRSQSPGEYHVAAQVKQALETATARGWANGLLQAWMAEALHISKHIKNEVTASRAPAEIEDLAVDFVCERLGDDWKGHTSLILGAGLLGRSLVKSVLARNGPCLWCYHAHRPALKAGKSLRPRLLPWDALNGVLAECDVVFCAAESTGYVLDRTHAKRFDPKRPVILLDLGAPRNVSPALGALLPAAELVNLDRLKAWAARRHGWHLQAMAESRQIVERHRDAYAKLIAQFQGRNPLQ